MVPLFISVYVLIFISSNIIYVSGTCSDDSLYLIRSTTSNLVVDASFPTISLQHFDGYTPQLWQFKHSRPGVYFIINNSTGKALDVAEDNVTLLLSKVDENSVKQQWFVNSNGRILNVGVNKNLDVRGAGFTVNNPIIVHPNNGHVAQEFVVKEKRTCN
ncbi:uncharacterized protein LOC135135486 [Zophobas morio]|uniref:uncharacterized protein LOC135135486 n=1 Tax=Zophobas morio TaxID=2755281 RepID=UPI003083D3FB